MLNPTEYGDEVVLNLVANLLEVDICVIPAFRESSIHQSLGVTVIKCMKETVHKPIFLAAFSESDFLSPHYQSVFPRTENNDLIRRISLPLPAPSLPPPQVFEDRSFSSLPLSLGPLEDEVFVLTEENINDVPIVVTDDPSRAASLHPEHFQRTRSGERKRRTRTRLVRK